MTREGWRAAMIEAMTRYVAGDSRFLDLIADLLADDDSGQPVCGDGEPRWFDGIDFVVDGVVRES